MNVTTVEAFCLFSDRRIIVPRSMFVSILLQFSIDSLYLKYEEWKHGIFFMKYEEMNRFENKTNVVLFFM